MYVKLYFADVSCLKDEKLYSKLSEKMTQARRDAADRLRFAKDRRLSVGAYSLLRYALIRAGEKGTFPIETGECGKPYFPDRPDICFNLSHSGDVALCALSDTDVGCDVEAQRRPPLSVAKRYFSSSEKDYLASARTDEERAERFFRVWTLKESVMKATGLGFSLAPSSFSAVDSDGGLLSPEVRGETFFVCDAHLRSGYRAAYCTRGARCDASVEEVFFDKIDF